MRSTKIYEILQQFDRIEHNRMRKYISSPYFNVNELLCQFFDLLVQDIYDQQNPKINKKEWEKEEAWASVSHKEPYGDVRFRRLCSDLLRLIEGFLAQEIYDKNTLQQATYLIDAVAKRRLEKLYNGVVRQARTISEQQAEHAGMFYFHQYQIEQAYYRLTEVELKRPEISNIEQVINNLDYFYLAEKIKWYVAVLSMKTMLSHEYEVLFIDEIINHLQKYPYDHVPAIDVYDKVLQMQLNQEDDQHFRQLVELLNKVRSEFSTSEQYELYHSALNYCIAKANTGKTEYLKDFLDLCKILLPKGILLAGGATGDELSPFLFKNITSAAFRLGEIAWAKTFIHQYKNHLPDHFRENAVSYNLATADFYEKNYSKALERLQAVEYDDIAYNLNAKTMTVAIYYELDEIEALIPFLDSFRVLIALSIMS